MAAGPDCKYGPQFNAGTFPADRRETVVTTPRTLRRSGMSECCAPERASKAGVVRAVVPMRDAAQVPFEVRDAIGEPARLVLVQVLHVAEHRRQARQAHALVAHVLA